MPLFFDISCQAQDKHMAQRAMARQNAADAFAACHLRQIFDYAADIILRRFRHAASYAKRAAIAAYDILLCQLFHTPLAAPHNTLP